MRKTFVLCLFILLIGCDYTPPISSGLVLEKHYEPERHWVQFVPQFVKVGDITVINYYQIWHVDDEDWALTLLEEDTQYYVYVTQEFWEKTQIGDYIHLQDPELEDDMQKITKEPPR